MTLRMLLMLALLLPACDDGGGGGGGSTDAGPGPAPDVIDFTLMAERQDAELVALQDGGEAPYVWGLQGGTMLRPAFRLAAAQWEVGDVFKIGIKRAPDPAAPDAYGDIGDFDPLQIEAEAWRDDDQRLYLGPFNDQLGWDELAGRRLIYEVSLERGSARGSARLALTLASPQADGPCAEFESTGGGCSYRRLPGTLRVTRVDDVALRCADGVYPSGTFTPSPAAQACADSLPFSQGLLTAEHQIGAGSRQCLADEAVVVGAELPATADVIERGTCSPWVVALDRDLSACGEGCF